ncbi:17384_t:CDS:2, partial [Racocetra persica]
TNVNNIASNTNNNTISNDNTKSNDNTISNDSSSNNTTSNNNLPSNENIFNNNLPSDNNIFPYFATNVDFNNSGLFYSSAKLILNNELETSRNERITSEPKNYVNSQDKNSYSRGNSMQISQDDLDDLFL